MIHKEEPFFVTIVLYDMYFGFFASFFLCTFFFPLLRNQSKSFQTPSPLPPTPYLWWQLDPMMRVLVTYIYWAGSRGKKQQVEMREWGRHIVEGRWDMQIDPDYL